MPDINEVIQKLQTLINSHKRLSIEHQEVGLAVAQQVHKRMADAYEYSLSLIMGLSEENKEPTVFTLTNVRDDGLALVRFEIIIDGTLGTALDLANERLIEIQKWYQENKVSIDTNQAKKKEKAHGNR